jgi:hypothetical protein
MNPNWPLYNDVSFVVVSFLLLFLLFLCDSRCCCKIEIFLQSFHRQSLFYKLRTVMPLLDDLLVAPSLSLSLTAAVVDKSSFQRWVEDDRNVPPDKQAGPISMPS